MDLHEGREIYPRLGSLDLKSAFFRIGMLSWLLVIASMMINDYSKTGKVNPTALFLAISQGIYAMDFLIFEVCTVSQ